MLCPQFYRCFYRPNGSSIYARKCFVQTQIFSLCVPPFCKFLKEIGTFWQHQVRLPGCQEIFCPNHHFSFSLVESRRYFFDFFFTHFFRDKVSSRGAGNVLSKPCFFVRRRTIFFCVFKNIQVSIQGCEKRFCPNSIFFFFRSPQAHFFCVLQPCEKMFCRSVRTMAFSFRKKYFSL